MKSALRFVTWAAKDVRTRREVYCAGARCVFLRRASGTAPAATEEEHTIRPTSFRQRQSPPSLSFRCEKIGSWSPRLYSSVGSAAMEARALESSSSKLPLAAASMATPGPLGQSIRDKLAAAFQPEHLDVINESHMHNVPKYSETHFKVVVVSSEFEGCSLIQRHRRVNEVLSEDLQRPGGIHALSIVAKTPQQWLQMVESGKAVEPSPTCRGGDGSLASRNPSQP